MIKKNILLYFMTVLLLTGCFSDDGNYIYKEINPPTWLINVETHNISVNCRIGEVAEFKASDKFVFEKDGREKEVRYEWWYGNTLISEELDFSIPTKELVKKMQLERLPERGVFGKFLIIEKDTDISFMARTYITIHPEFAQLDWAVLSEDGQNSKVSVIKHRSKVIDNQTKSVFTLDDNIYEKINGRTIPGKPIEMHHAKARNIGPLGSITVMTDQATYEIDVATMKFAREIQEDFPDGVPDNFQVTDRDDIDGAGDFGEGSFSFLTTKSGEVFTRNMSANYLGGKFISDPYVIDDKGYNITKFGHHTYGYPNIPCWDAKNRRVVMANRWRTDVQGESGEIGDQTSVYKCRLVPVKPDQEGQSGIPVWDMPEGTDALFLTQVYYYGYGVFGQNTAYSLYYNDVDGNSFVGDFVISNEYLTVSYNVWAAKRWYRLPDKLDENTIFLTSSSQHYDSSSPTYQFLAIYRTLYSQGNKVKYMQRSFEYTNWEKTFEELLTVDSNITFMTYEFYDCKTLIIGCENGDVYLYDVSNIKNPQLIDKFNVGGKVVSAKEFGTKNNYFDYY